MNIAANTQPAFFHPRYWIAWIGIGLATVVAYLPWRLLFAIGVLIGRSAFYLARSRRRIAQRNLQLCFPELSEAERGQLLRKCFRSLGIGLMEFMRAWFGPLGDLDKRSTLTGLQHVDAALAHGKGVIILSGHFLTLELCGRILTQHLPAPLAGMYRVLDNPVFEWAVKRGRLRYASNMFAREQVRGALRQLKQNQMLWYAPDQGMRGKDSVFVPFFGINAQTITATHSMARLSGAKVMAFYHRRRPDGLGYILELKPALENFPSADAVADTARINALIEDMVRAAPDEYLWVHRRFKYRPEGEADIYQ